MFAPRLASPSRCACVSRLPVRFFRGRSDQMTAAWDGGWSSAGLDAAGTPWSLGQTRVAAQQPRGPRGSPLAGVRSECEATPPRLWSSLRQQAPPPWRRHRHRHPPPPPQPRPPSRTRSLFRCPCPHPPTGVVGCRPTGAPISVCK